MFPHWPKIHKSSRRKTFYLPFHHQMCFLLNKIPRVMCCHILMDRKQDWDSTEPTINSGRITE